MVDPFRDSSGMSAAASSDVRQEQVTLPAADVAATGLLTGRQTVAAQVEVSGASASTEQSVRKTQVSAHAAAVTQQRDDAVTLARDRAVASEITEAEIEARALRAAAQLRPPRATLRPTPPREPRRFGRLHVGQIVAAETAIVIVVAALRQPLAVLIPVGALALLILVLALVPVHGVWLYRNISLRIRYLVRSRRREIKRDQVHDVLNPFARGGVIEMMDIDDEEVAVISQAGGFTAVIEVGFEADVAVHAAAAALPPLSEFLVTHDEDGPVISAQVIIHVVPAPGPRTDLDAAARSYAELSGGALPGARRVWLAIQAMHTFDEYTSSELRAALGNGVRKARRKLAKGHLRSTCLGPEELRAEMLGLMDANWEVKSDSDRLIRTEEAWNHVAYGDSRQLSFRLLGWPNLADERGVRLIELLGGVRSYGTTFSVAVRRTGDSVEFEGAVRLAVADSAQARAATADLNAAATECGALVEPMDGEQIYGITATAPLGGFSV